MKKFLILFLFVLFSINTFAYNLYGNNKTYYYNDAYFDTYAFGIGYSYFNEAQASKMYRFKAHEINMFAVIYGIYIDANIAPSQWSYFDQDKMGSWGMNFGYMVPLMKKNSRAFRIYAGPVIGFQNVGKWYSSINRYTTHYCDPYYGCNTYSCSYSTSYFSKDNSYFDFGGVLAISYKNLWLQFKGTRTTFAGGIGFCF